MSCIFKRRCMGLLSRGIHSIINPFSWAQCTTYLHYCIVRMENLDLRWLLPHVPLACQWGYKVFDSLARNMTRYCPDVQYGKISDSVKTLNTTFFILKMNMYVEMHHCQFAREHTWTSSESYDVAVICAIRVALWHMKHHTLLITILTMPVVASVNVMDVRFGMQLSCRCHSKWVTSIHTKHFTICDGQPHLIATS